MSPLTGTLPAQFDQLPATDQAPLVVPVQTQVLALSVALWASVAALSASVKIVRRRKDRDTLNSS